MIFVTVGTTQYSFRRLIDWAIRQAELSKRKKFIIQSGVYKYQGVMPQNVIIQQYFSFAKVQHVIQQSDIIICHAGMGTIIQCWGYGKKPWVVPRLEKCNEHANDHETTIANYLLDKEKIFVLDISSENLPKIPHKKKIVINGDTASRKKLLRYLSSIC